MGALAGSAAILNSVMEELDEAMEVLIEQLKNNEA